MDLSRITVGKEPPHDLNVIIEIPAGSSIKYEFDKEAGCIVVDRFSFTAFGFPANYGFVPHTLCDDGDPLDVLVIASQPILPGSLIRVRPIGVMEMEDEAGVDPKIIALPMAKADPTFAKIEDIADLPENTVARIKHFYEHYKDLEKGKWVKVQSVMGKKEALSIIEAAIQAGSDKK
jgi:inorganic pyrophosphatase